VSGEWRVDPTGRYEYRWWDGERFTEYVARHGAQIVDPAGIPDLPTTIEVGFGSPERQNRWTVGFRLILAIPHFFWIALVTLAGLVVLVIGWFGALFSGQLPGWAARYLYLVMRYHVRLTAYVYLLRGEYPPFALSDERSPVVVEVNPTRLNRWAVLFRLVLAFPVLVLAQWLSVGVNLALIVIWIIVLAKGRMPGLPAQSLGAVLRYQARVFGYLMMLTPTYPVGLYGDKEQYPGMAAAAPAIASEVGPGVPPRTARMYLGQGAKRLVTVFMVLGILYNVANNVLNWRTDEQDLSVARTAQVVDAPDSGAGAAPGESGSAQ